MPACDKRSSLRRLVSRFWPGLNESVTATTETFRAHVRHAHLSSSSSSCTKVNRSEISQGRHVALDSYQISVPQIVLHTMRNYLGVHISFSLAAEGFPRPPLPLLRFFTPVFLDSLLLLPTVNPFEHIYGQLPEGIQLLLLGERACNCY